MAANDAFTAGVRPGGLTSSTEIRLLLCYLVKNAGPIARQEIENAPDGRSAGQLLSRSAPVWMISPGSSSSPCKGNVYSITDKGRKVAQELATTCPRSVRERAVAAVLRCQTWARKRKPSTVPASPKRGRPLHHPLHRERAWTVRCSAWISGTGPAVR